MCGVLGLETAHLSHVSVLGRGCNKKYFHELYAVFELYESLHKKSKSSFCLLVAKKIRVVNKNNKEKITFKNKLPLLPLLQLCAGDCEFRSKNSDFFKAFNSFTSNLI